MQDQQDSMLVVVYDGSLCKMLGIYGHNMVAAVGSNLMPHNYATRTGEASCELPESQQVPQSHERVTNVISRQKTASK